MDVYTIYVARIAAAIQRIQADLKTLPDGPEKEQLRQAMEELERIAEEQLEQTNYT